jgi:2-oxoglutarate ferredoxin oxidoreductase subunit beta
VATTTPGGRDPDRDGAPIDISQMLAVCQRTVYIERCALTSVKHIQKAKRAIKKSFLVQLNNLGFSLVELLSPCPTNWKMNPSDAWRWAESILTKTYPLGVIKDTSGLGDVK